MLATIYTWATTIICLTGTILNVKKLKAGFYLWTAGNIAWLVWDVSQGLWSRAVLDTVQLALAVWGIHEWSKDGKRAEPDTASA